MPTYAYKCEDCERKFEIFFKVKEDTDEVLCPDCGSRHARRLISAGSFSMKSGASAQVPSCATGGGCAGGACPFAG